MIIENLQKLGLNKKEAALYMQMVHLGAQPASVLSRVSGINRTTTYDILETLTGKGLIRSTKKSGSTYFEALSPKELHNYLDREKNEYIRKIEKQQKTIEEILPLLISLENPESSKPKVTFYEGEKGMREAYENTLTSKEDILAYANVEEMHNGLPNFFPDYYKRRGLEKNIHIRAIMPDNESSVERAKKDKTENRKTLLIPKSKFEFTPELNIYNDKVLIASWREKMAIIIQSKEIADLHRKTFELAWEAAGKYEKKLPKSKARA